MQVSETKTIDTLVDDIYNLVDTGKKKPDQEALFALGSTIMDAVKRQLWMATSDAPGRLRMSNIGKPCSRQLWYDINGDDKAEGFSPQTRLKFMIGDIVEAFIIYLAKEAGHSVTEQQAEIEMDGIKGHIDCVIDDELVDIKSASSFAMKKFKNGTLPDDDPFGYIIQGHLYGEATGLPFGGWIVINKSSGEVTVVEAPDWQTDDRKEYMADAKERIKVLTDESLEFKVPFKDVFEVYKQDGQEVRTGNKLLPRPCNMCGYKAHCWKDAVVHDKVTSKAKQPPQVWYSRLKRKSL